MLGAPPLMCSCGRSQPRGVQMQLHRVAQHWCTSKASPASREGARGCPFCLQWTPSPASCRCTTCCLGWLHFQRLTQAKASLLSVPTTAAKDGATQSQALAPVCALHVVAVGCWCTFVASLAIWLCIQHKPCLLSVRARLLLLGGWHTLEARPVSCLCNEACCFP